MKYIQLECSSCETEYGLEYDNNTAIGKPDICPFCGEEIKEDYLDDEDYDLDEEDE